jgi:hypothetical protein
MKTVKTLKTVEIDPIIELIYKSFCCDLGHPSEDHAVPFRMTEGELESGFFRLRHDKLARALIVSFTDPAREETFPATIQGVLDVIERLAPGIADRMDD